MKPDITQDTLLIKAAEEIDRPNVVQFPRYDVAGIAEANAARRAVNNFHSTWPNKAAAIETLRNAIRREGETLAQIVGASTAAEILVSVSGEIRGLEVK